METAAPDRNRDGDHELANIPVPAAIPEVRPDVAMAIAEAVPAAPTQRSRSRLTASIIALLATLFIASINATLISNSIPSICADLKSADGYAWIGGAYLLANAASTPIWAKFSDIWGRKLILLCAVASFSLSSILCALAVNMTMLIAGRALQGVCAGGLISIVSIVISDLFSMKSRSLLLGSLEIVWAIAGTAGPITGGAFSQHLTWRWNFWIMLPPCAFAFVLLYFALDVHNPQTGMMDGLRAVDWAGSFSMLALMIMLLLGLNFGGVDYPWNSPTVICLIIFGAFMSVFLIFSEKKLAKYPLLPLEIFHTKSNIAALIIGFTHDFGLFALEYYLPLEFQSAKGLTPVNSGVLVLPFAVATPISGFLSGYYISHRGRYIELFWTGQALMLVGFGVFIHWDANTSIAEIAAAQVIVGLGVGMLFAPPVIVLQSSLPQEHTATATATLGLVRNLATVLAVVIGQTVFQNGMSERHGELMAAGLDKQLLDAFAGNAAGANIGMVASIADPVQKAIVQQTFAWSMRGIWILVECLTAVGFLCTFFITQHKLSDEHVETRTGLDMKKEEVQT